MRVAPLTSISFVSAAENHQKGPSKSPVQEGVQEGVQSWVNVPQPQPGCPQLPGHWVVNEGVYNIGDEKRCPAQAEAAHDHCQCFCCLSLDAHPTVCYGRVIWWGGAHRRPEAVVLQRVRGRGASHSDHWICASDRSRASPLKCLNLPHVSHGGDVNALVGQDHEGQRDVEGHGGADQGVRPVDQKHTACVVGASSRCSPLFNLEKVETEN